MGLSHFRKQRTQLIKGIDAGERLRFFIGAGDPSKAVGGVNKGYTGRLRRIPVSLCIAHVYGGLYAAAVHDQSDVFTFGETGPSRTLVVAEKS